MADLDAGTYIQHNEGQHRRPGEGPAMTTPLVEIRDLSVTVGGKTILAGVNADLAQGQITALIGLNGSGKTTLLRALLKEMPYTGRIVFHCGHDHRRPTPRARRLRAAEAANRRQSAADRPRSAGAGPAAAAAVSGHQPPRARKR